MDRGERFVQVVVEGLVKLSDAQFLRVTLSSSPKAKRNVETILQDVLDAWRKKRTKADLQQARVPVVLEIVAEDVLASMSQATKHSARGAFAIEAEKHLRLLEQHSSGEFDAEEARAVLHKFGLGAISARKVTVDVPSNLRLPLRLLPVACDTLRKHGFLAELFPHGESPHRSSA